MKAKIHFYVVLALSSVMLAMGAIAEIPEAGKRGFVSEEILLGPERTPAFVLRDKYRHPAETLAFFDVQSTMTVIEIWPGSGWYTEILAQHLSEGKLYAAHFSADSEVKYFRDSRQFYEEKLKAYPDIYGAVELVEFNARANRLTVPPAVADRILTFRNVHNWMGEGAEAKAFALFYNALKPGGILGVVEHRAKPGTDWKTMKQSGYMTEAYVIELAQQAGFVLDARSEVNANPRDSADHSHGVWSLPPTLRGDDSQRARYLAIGESDRMTLRFRKPLDFDP